MKTGACYWRFKGEKSFRYGYALHVKGDLYRMGRWNGDTSGGPIVDSREVERREA